METTTVSDLLRKVTEGNETVLELVNEADNGVKHVTFGQRKLAPQIPLPERAESPPRAHVLHTPEAVVHYVNQYGSDATVILLDAESMTGRVVLDEAGRDGFEVLSFRPTIHPLFAEWNKLLGHRIDVLEFAQFVMLHRRQIVEPDGKTVALIFSQLRADKTAVIHVGEGKSAINGVVVSVKIGGQVRDTPVELPDSICLEVPIFIGGAPMSVAIDLLVGEADGKIYVLASAAGILEAQHKAFAEMAAVISEGVKHEAVIEAGCVNHGIWNYLKA